MNEWLSSFLSKVSINSSPSRRLAAVTVGCVLLLWLNAGLRTESLPSIDWSVLVFVAIVLGTTAIHPPPTSP